jgi:hypothetical protein
VTLNRFAEQGGCAREAREDMSDAEDVNDGEDVDVEQDVEEDRDDDDENGDAEEEQEEAILDLPLNETHLRGKP